MHIAYIVGLKVILLSCIHDQFVLQVCLLVLSFPVGYASASCCKSEHCTSARVAVVGFCSSLFAASAYDKTVDWMVSVDLSSRAEAAFGKVFRSAVILTTLYVKELSCLQQMLGRTSTTENKG